MILRTGRSKDGTMNNPGSTPFAYRIAIVGHPTTPDVAWSDEQLLALRDVGFNTLNSVSPGLGGRRVKC